jgi:hypothetical protein
VQWRQWPAYKVVNASETAQLDDAKKNGFQVIAHFPEDEIEKVYSTKQWISYANALIPSSAIHLTDVLFFTDGIGLS